MSDRAEAFRKKALRYERAAKMATDPNACHDYLDLARQLRAKAEEVDAFEQVANPGEESGSPARMAGSST